MADLKQTIENQMMRLNIARETGDKTGEMKALGVLGDCWYNLGSPRKAIEYYEGGLNIAVEIGDKQSEAWTLANLGHIFLKLGSLGEAEMKIEQSLSIARQIGDKRSEGYALGHLGDVYFTLYNHGKESQSPQLTTLPQLTQIWYDKAIQSWEEAHDISVATGNNKLEASTLYKMAVAHSENGDYERAVELFEHQLFVVQAIGDVQGEGLALMHMGYNLYEIGKKKQGIESMKKALVIFERTGSPNSEIARAKLQEWM